MAYTDVPDTDIDVDSPLKTGMFEDLRDNIRALRQSLFAWLFVENSTTATSYTTLETCRVYIPNVTSYTGLTRQITVRIEVKVSGGTGTYRLQDNATATNGTGVTSTSTSYEEKEMSLTVDAGWVDTVRTINLQVQVTSTNTAYIQSVDRATHTLEY